MSILSADVRFNRSVSTGSSGGAMDVLEITSGTQNNLFDDIADADRILGGTQTKKWFLYNASTTDAMSKPLVWLGLTPTNITEELGLGFDDANDTDAAACGNMVAMTSDTTVELTSDQADSRTVTIYGINSSNIPTAETVLLTGSSPKASSTIWSTIYGCHVSAIGNPTVTITQSDDDSVIGTIVQMKACCFLWRQVGTFGDAFQLPDLPAEGAYGFWDRLTWAAGVGGVRPDTSTISVQENVT